MMQHPPIIANVYPCLDWVPQGVAKSQPTRLKLTGEEVKAVITQAQQRALEARKRLGGNANESGRQMTSGNSVLNSSTDGQNGDDEDDVIMKEYGLNSYDQENDLGGIPNSSDGAQAEMSEDDEDEATDTTRASLTGDLANQMAGLTYHASNAEDPYLGGNTGDLDDDKEEEEELAIKPTDNMIVTGHVSADECSLKVYVYDNEHQEFYLHHDIIQSDYPCCMKWIGHAKKQSKNIAAVGYMGPDIMLWDLDIVDSLEPMEVLSGHEDAVIDLCWNNQTKNILASGSADDHVRLWDLDECKSFRCFKLPGKVVAVEFGLHDKSLLLAGDLAKNVSMIDTRTNSVVNSWHLNSEAERVRWMPSNSSIFLATDDLGNVYEFDLRNSKNGKATHKFRAHNFSVIGLEFSPRHSDMLITASSDDFVKVWDMRSISRSTGAAKAEPTLVKEITNLKVGRILSLKMCPEAAALIAIGGDIKCNSFRTYDLMSLKEGKFTLS